MQEFKMPFRPQNSNKGTFGKVLNFSGCDNYIGAAYLSTLSSLKVGAGLSALATVDKVIKNVSTILPEAVYYTRKEGLEKIKQFSVVLIGCGLGVNKDSIKCFKEVVKSLEEEEISLIIDADGLNILAENFLKLPKNSIITPHPMEASRLLNCSLDEVLSDLEGSAKKLSKKYNCITVLKTHRTIICNRDFEFSINGFGNSALAKAGSGDVLAGIIAGLLAQKAQPFEAGKLGVYLHSRAGEIASKDLTEYGVLASDIVNYLPQAIKEIL